MTWTLSHDLADGGTVSAALPNPTFGDTHGEAVRQEALRTDGGTVWIQDLGVVDRTLVVSWPRLTGAEVSGLLRVIRAADYMRGLILASVVGDEPYPVGVAPGQVACGRALAPDGTWAPGDTVLATTFDLALYLDDPRIEIVQEVSHAAAVTLRFRKAHNRPLRAGV